MGGCGTGKTHLLTGLAVTACRQQRRLRFATAVKWTRAKHQSQLAAR
jgi:DNA replication protein DnaC